MKIKKIKWVTKNKGGFIYGYINNKHFFTIYRLQCDYGYELVSFLNGENEIIYIKDDENMDKRKLKAQEMLKEYVNNFIENYIEE